ncbi:Multidrug efflux pump subunit AcrB [Arsukibacterium tuosuense]|uniref:Multidrug efflux pump subunit AcrB n=1 Tax=Arsukibacterium tuosuense TaxID=1323745 RepID=A0A285JEU4_9GAMM|nr:efflux RND transporter permease subunit [Arsukibacterium tuosuense]SNY58810.1 Multidrug efflux pump subunit AcrB [Arsukibacterium tuosuense]
MSKHLGVSGGLADRFKINQITPLLALVGFLLGLFAVLVTPREEEPQIEVTFANVFIPYTGASAAMVEKQVAIAAEKIVAEIAGIEHVYSVSEAGMAILTVQFKVGEPRTEALVRLYNAFYANADWQPADSQIGPVLIKPKGIDDVPIYAVTLWSDNPAVSRAALSAAAKGLEEQLQQIAGTRDIYTLGATPEQILVRFDVSRLAAYKLDLARVQAALQQNNGISQQMAMLVPHTEILLESGVALHSVDDVAQLIISVQQTGQGPQPVYLADVADIRAQSAKPDSYVQHVERIAGTVQQNPAVTLYVAKQPGQNAVDVTRSIQRKLDNLSQYYLSQDIKLTESRNYGDTAKDKADTLIKKLLFATLSVVLLVGFALGWREAFVVGMAVIITLAITLFASWAYGFTLNRVSLFALIFSIGILVDDAIVVVENLHRHWLDGKQSLLEAIPSAVEEVGAPTILATFTVVAALLPMAFVSGLMGPYMSPIPINASMGMLISLLVAFIFTPWLFYRVFANRTPAAGHHAQHGGKAERLFNRVMLPFLRARAGRTNRIWLLLGLLVAIAGSVLLVQQQVVTLKMLPFDNKSEFQVVVDLPEGSTLEQTQAVLNRISLALLQQPEVLHVQSYAGTAAPINFNGLVRQYYLRRYPWQGDVQVNLAGRLARDEQSHAIALRVRPALAQLALESGASIKLVEVPPGPPVMAPLVAEVYGPDYASQLTAAAQISQVFAQAEHVTDIDSTIEAAQPRWQLLVDQHQAALHGVSVAAINQALQIALSGQNGGYLRSEQRYNLTPIQLKLTEQSLADWQQLQRLPIPSMHGGTVPLSELVMKQQGQRQNAIYRKDLRPVVFVTADLAGGSDSPLYGMLDIRARLNQQMPTMVQQLISAPDDTDAVSIKWDGEWQITYETFRDMGLAYGVGLIMIYLLVVAQFKSYGVPLIIMAPIPLTLIGIMPGHWLMQAQFTATSMIGMIALAGIIVRNSILLVDYIQQQLAQGVALQQAVIHASAVRARPIILTGLAAMLGAFFILDDPIFGGLAVALIFGILVSTLLTLVVIPVVYYAYHYADTEQPG